MNRTIRFLLLSLVFLFWWVGTLSAQYTLVLKNGRRMTVQSYREEGGMIKFYGLGGEIGIARDQIQSILESGATEGRGMVFPGSKRIPGKPAAASKTSNVKKVVSPGPGDKAKVEGKKEGAAEAEEKVLTPEEKLAEERAKEEKEYQKRIADITAQIKAAEDRYVIAIKGGRKGGVEAGICVTNCTEYNKARAADLNSRLKDRVRGPARGGNVILKTPSSIAGKPNRRELRASGIKVPPRASAPLPNYKANEWEISQLNKQIAQLREKREKLIQEMKQKNFDSGSLFLQ